MVHHRSEIEAILLPHMLEYKHMENLLGKSWNFPPSFFLEFWGILSVRLKLMLMSGRVTLYLLQNVVE